MVRADFCAAFDRTHPALGRVASLAERSGFALVDRYHSLIMARHDVRIRRVSLTGVSNNTVPELRRLLPLALCKLFQGHFILSEFVFDCDGVSNRLLALVNRLERLLAQRVQRGLFLLKVIGGPHLRAL